MELEEIRRNILIPRAAEKTQEINDIPVIEERIQNESRLMEPSETETRLRVEIKITDQECLIIDELKALMIKNETEEYLLFKKADQRKFSDVTKKVNAVIIHNETDDLTETNKLAMAVAPWVAKDV